MTVIYIFPHIRVIFYLFTIIKNIQMFNLPNIFLIVAASNNDFDWGTW